MKLLEDCISINSTFNSIAHNRSRKFMGWNIVFYYWLNFSTSLFLKSSYWSSILVRTSKLLSVVIGLLGGVGITLLGTPGNIDGGFRGRSLPFTETVFLANRSVFGVRNSIRNCFYPALSFSRFCFFRWQSKKFWFYYFHHSCFYSV